MCSNICYRIELSAYNFFDMENKFLSRTVNVGLRREKTIFEVKFFFSLKNSLVLFSTRSRDRKIAIILRSKSDWPVMKEACHFLADFGFDYVKDIVSAHLSPKT